MPAPLDLTGQRIGALLVLGRADDRASASGRSHWRLWRCQCSCGRVEDIPQPRLRPVPSAAARAVTACSACRQPACVVCGARVPLERGRRNTCCEACELVNRRGNDLDNYYRHTASDPDYNRRRHARALAALSPAELVAFRAAQHARAAQRWAETLADPARHAAQRARVRAWYAVNGERVQAARRARLDALSPDAYARWAERTRAYQRAYRRRWRADLAAHPERHAAYLALMQEYARQWRRRQALQGLMAISDDLERRK